MTHGPGVVTSGHMATRSSGRGANFGVWRGFAVALFLVVSAASCGNNQVVQPVLDGTVWTRLTPPDYDGCLFPDILVDSLIYSTAVPVPVGGGNFQFFGRIAVSGIDGSKPVKIVYLGDAPWNDLRPRWAGRQRIVFMDNRQGSYDIWYKDLETFREYRLTSYPGHETAPMPRPGTQGLIYVELRPGAVSAYDFGRLVLIPDTTAVPLQRIYLTPDTLQCGDPDWDATGTKLCYSVQNNADYTRHIYTMDLVAGDSIPVPVTTGASHDVQPRWSPDGTRIVFASDRTARSGIWVVNPQGEAKGIVLISFDDTGKTANTPTFTPDQTGIIVSSNGRGSTRGLWLISNLPDIPF